MIATSLFFLEIMYVNSIIDIQSTDAMTRAHDIVEGVYKCNLEVVGSQLKKSIYVNCVLHIIVL